jgi:hypothetical protein
MFGFCKCRLLLGRRHLCVSRARKCALGASQDGPSYISSVRRSLMSRLAALLVASLAGFAAPAAALGHGVAHARAHQQEHFAAEHAEAPGHAAALDWHGGDLHHDRSTVSGLGDEADHPHPQLDCALRVRPDIPAFVLLVPAVVPCTRVLHLRSEPPVAHDALPRADPSHGPPPRLRAPPLR